MSAALIRHRIRSRLANTVAAIATSLIMLAMTPPAIAQDMPSNDDLRALLFYFDASDTDSTNAELRRLQSQFPQWVPPADLSALRRSTASSPDLDPIYRRISSGDVTGARAAIATAQGSFPGWSPPADMLSLLRASEDQSALDAALAQGNLGAALDLVRGNAELLRCNRVNNAWRLAELQISTNNKTAALGTYGAVIGTCSSIRDVVATLDKARATATDSELSALVETARRRFPGEQAALDATANRLLGSDLRPTVANDPVATTQGSTAKPPVVVSAPRAAAVASRVTPPAAIIIARPMATVAAPTSARYASLPRSGDGRLQATRSAGKSGNFTTCTATSTRPRSLDVAYERAWCVYNLDRPMEALALFTAVASGGPDATVVRDARFGMALAYTKLGMTENAAKLAASTPFSPDQRRDVEAIILDQRGVRAYQRGDFKRAIAFFDGLEALQGTLRRDLSILRAYSYLNTGRRAEAHVLFTELNRELATEETRRGVAASQ